MDDVQLGHLPSPDYSTSQKTNPWKKPILKVTVPLNVIYMIYDIIDIHIDVIHTYIYIYYTVDTSHDLGYIYYIL